MLACLYIVFWAINSKTAWMDPEAFIRKSQIMQDVMAGSWGNVFKRPFDAVAFEFAPRTTRPFASLFEIVDTVLRSYLWKSFTPHPSLSLSWILTLFFSPWLLYRIFIMRGVASFVAISLIGVYLTQMGTLSYVVTLARPGKPVTLFFLIGCWYLCELLVLEGFKWKRYCLLLVSLLASSFFDEYTLLTYMFSALMTFSLLRNRPRLIIPFVMPAIIYLLTVYYLFPWLTNMFYGQNIALKNYGTEFGLYLALSNFMSYELIYLLLFNSWVLIRESFCIYNPFDISNLLCRAIVFVHLAVTILMMVALLGRLTGEIISKGIKNTFAAGSSMSFVLLCTVIAMLFHGATMSIVQNKIWGPYYYGAFIGVMVTLFIAELWKLNGFVRKISCFWILTLVLASMVTFPAINNVYKQSLFYPYKPGKIRQAYIRMFNRFEFSDKQFLPNDDIKLLSSIDWQKQDKPVDVPKHLLWVVIECAGMNYPFSEFSSNSLVASYSINNRGVRPASNVK